MSFVIKPLMVIPRGILGWQAETHMVNARFLVMLTPVNKLLRVFDESQNGFRQAVHAFYDLSRGITANDIMAEDYSDTVIHPDPHFDHGDYHKMIARLKAEQVPIH